MYQEKNTLQYEQIPNRNEFKFLEMGYAFKSNKDDLDYKGFTRNIFGGMDIIKKIREKQNNTGIYRTAFFYNTTDPYGSYLYGDFFMDFDSEDNIELAKEDLMYTIWFFHLKMGFDLPMEAFHIYFSGKKGFHLIIPSVYFGYDPSKSLHEDFKWIARELNDRSPNQTIDLAVYERRRLFRLENSIHQSTGLYKIPINYKELIDLPIGEIYRLAQSPRIIEYPRPSLHEKANKQWFEYMKDFENFKKMQYRKRGNGPSITKGEIPESVQEVIDNGPIQGLRNETIAALASFYKNQEYTQEEIEQSLLEWNAGSLPEREVLTTVRSIINKDLNYGINRFKSLAKGEIASYEEDFEEYKKYKRTGRLN